MSLYDFTPPSEEELTGLIGPEPALEPFAEEEFQTSPVQRILEGLARGARGVQAPRPRNFGQGLASGLVQGLAGSGARVATARERFEKRQDARRLRYDEDRRRATEEYRKRRGETLIALSKEQREERRNRGEVVTENDVARIPALKPLLGQPVTQATRERAALAMAETPARDRQVAAAERAANAAERAERQASFTNINQLRDDFKNDPDITAYRSAVQNVRTVRDAAKLKTGPGDLLLLISYVRATEPGIMSVVRQEELTNVEKAIGEFRRVGARVSNFFTGQRFPSGPEGDKIRQEFVSGAEAAASSRKEPYDFARSQFARTATRFGEDPTLFLRDYDISEKPNRTERPPLDSFWRPY